MGDLSTIVTLVSAAIGVLGWFFRLEGRVNYNEKLLIEIDKEVDHLRAKHEALDSKVFEKLMSVEKALARIEGALGVKTEKEKG